MICKFCQHDCIKEFLNSTTCKNHQVEICYWDSTINNGYSFIKQNAVNETIYIIQFFIENNKTKIFWYGEDYVHDYTKLYDVITINSLLELHPDHNDLDNKIQKIITFH